MPDSDWENMSGNDEARSESDRQPDGKMPDHRYSSSETTPTVDGNNIESKRVTEVYSKLQFEGQGQPSPVSHVCNHCGSAETETYNPAIAFPTDSSHAPLHNWGYQTGEMFASVKVTGLVKRRETDLFRQQGANAWQENKYKWSKKTIDHVEARPYVAWGDLVPVNCAHGVQNTSVSLWSGNDETEHVLVAFLERAGFVGKGSAFNDRAAVMAELGSLTRRLDMPRYSIETQGEGVRVAVIDATTNKRVGVLELAFDDGARRTLVTKNLKQL